MGVAGRRVRAGRAARFETAALLEPFPRVGHHPAHGGRGGRTPTAAGLAQLPLCRGENQEAMRLYPPVFIRDGTGPGPLT